MTDEKNDPFQIAFLKANPPPPIETMSTATQPLQTAQPIQHGITQLEPQPFEFNFWQAELHEWAVIEHRISTASVERLCVYVGVERTENMFSLRKLQNIQPWKTLYEASNRVLFLRFVKAFAKREDALRLQRDLTIEYGIKSAQMQRYRNPVRHIRTGRVFDSSLSAAESFGISASAMSNHLNKRPGYAKIHGEEFERLPVKEGIGEGFIKDLEAAQQRAERIYKEMQK